MNLDLLTSGISDYLELFLVPGHFLVPGPLKDLKQTAPTVVWGNYSDGSRFKGSSFCGSFQRSMLRRALVSVFGDFEFCKTAAPLSTARHEGSRLCVKYVLRNQEHLNLGAVAGSWLQVSAGLQCVRQDVGQIEPESSCVSETQRLSSAIEGRRSKLVRSSI